jgi:hypothetical protein
MPLCRPVSLDRSCARRCRAGVESPAHVQSCSTVYILRHPSVEAVVVVGCEREIDDASSLRLASDVSRSARPLTLPLVLVHAAAFNACVTASRLFEGSCAPVADSLASSLHRRPKCPAVPSWWSIRPRMSTAGARRRGDRDGFLAVRQTAIGTRLRSAGYPYSFSVGAGTACADTRGTRVVSRSVRRTCFVLNRAALLRTGDGVPPVIRRRFWAGRLRGVRRFDTVSRQCFIGVSISSESLLRAGHMLSSASRRGDRCAVAGAARGFATHFW